MSAATIVAVLAAGALGAVLRYLVSRFFAPRPGDFPWAVLVVNVVGSAIGGAALGLAQAGLVSADARLILLTGLCGGLTTFSTFSVETIQLVMERKARSAVASVALNLTLGIGVAAVAYALTAQA
ncbi:CrcB protein [Leifsonia sp. AK011]|uniref:fluoride efflux transporter CrcB n=1 Tax=Leifsonia sp. AK011 TaxID=2723075 RepID=UPI0015CED2F0|nr:fluoride efflux transporter CrcB [Leifsonia sp. AK011]NYF09450.1 CrcB protein [Leifsonia sp. AK011]